MRIAILTPTLYEFSGIDREVELQAKQCVQRGDDVSVFTLDAAIALNGVSIIILGMPKKLFWQRVYRLFFFFDIVKIFRYIRALRNFDVIYSHLYPMNILALGAKYFYRKRYVYYNNGVAPAYTFHKFHEKIYINFFRFLTNLTARNADEVISISNFLGDIFEKENKKPSRTQHIAIDSNRFHPGIDRTNIRLRYGFDKNPLVLYVGRLSPHKGIDLLIRSFREILPNIPQARLIIAGRPTFSSYYESLKNMGGPEVIFAGAVPDEELPYYYAACDIYATASLWEGFDMPLVEAQACGRSVVAFDIGPHKELINENGILVPPKNVAQFSKALIKLLP